MLPICRVGPQGRAGAGNGPAMAASHTLRSWASSSSRITGRAGTLRQAVVVADRRPILHARRPRQFGRHRDLKRGGFALRDRRGSLGFLECLPEPIDLFLVPREESEEDRPGCGWGSP